MSEIIKNITGRILMTVFAGLFGLSSYFIYTEYQNHIELVEEDVLSCLQGISRTLSLQLSGDDLTILFNNFPNKDDIKSTEENEIYQTQHNILKRAVEINGIESPIYTLSFDSAKKEFFFGITSSENPYYRHPYKQYPKELLKYYTQGNFIPMYKDEHGTWLSAFAPIKDSQGIVRAVIQVDKPFDAFIMEARKDLFTNISVSLLVCLIIGFVLYRLIKGILDEEEKLKKEKEKSKRLIEQKNRDILDSITYASRIQNSIIPEENDIAQHFAESFVLYKPKDIVSGDFYWYNKVKFEGEDQCILAVIDCTGHGVPGAFMSVIGYSLLNQIILEGEASNVCGILNILNERIIFSLKQNESSGTSEDGMEMGLVAVGASGLRYAGANRPLFWVNKGELKIINGDKMPIGGSHYPVDRKFTSHQIPVEKGDCVYLFSDGYVDQFGGPNEKKFMTKKLKDLIKDHHLSPMKDQQKIFNTTIENWMAGYDQVDDITLIGIRF